MLTDSGTVNNGWLSDVPADADNDGIIRLFGGIRQPNSQYEQVHLPNSGKNQPCTGIDQALGRGEAEQCTQQCACKPPQVSTIQQ